MLGLQYRCRNGDIQIHIETCAVATQPPHFTYRPAYRSAVRIASNYARRMQQRSTTHTFSSSSTLHKQILIKQMWF
jgi:hypothetical protein